MRSFLLFFFIISLLVLAGCGDPPECEVDSDCSAGVCQTPFCTEDGFCSTEIIKDCCGNGLLEDGENKCNCEEDAGVCEYNSTEGAEYITALCDDYEGCVMEIKEDIVETETITKSLEMYGFAANMRITYQNPFNIEASEILIEMELKSMEADVVNPKITKIEAVTTLGRTQKALGEKSVNKQFWTRGSKIYENLFFNYEMLGEVEKLPLDLIVYYEYEQVTDRGNNLLDGEYKVNILDTGEPLVVVKTGREYSCELDRCDDKNSGTIDSCVEGTPFCQHMRRPNVCGNFKCDVGENKCTCPRDCGPCEGPASEYLVFGCNEEDECVTKLDSASKEQVLLNKMDGYYFGMAVESVLNQPFDIDNDTMSFYIELNSMNEELVKEDPYDAVTIEKIEVLGYRTKKFGSLTVSSDNKLNDVFNKLHFEVPISYDLENAEESIPLSYQVYYAYRTYVWDYDCDCEKPSSIIRETLEIDLGNMIFVDAE